MNKLDLEQFAIKQLKHHKIYADKKVKFLKRLQSNFDIDKLSKKLENFYELDFKTFLKEQDEWEEYFESYLKELLEIKAQIDKTDYEIEKMVYGLYGLREEKICIIENQK